MKTILLILILMLTTLSTFAQRRRARLDSLQMELKRTMADTARVKLMQQIALFYNGYNIDSSIHFAQQGLTLAKKNGDPKIILRGLWVLAYSMTEKDIPQSMVIVYDVIKGLKSNRVQDSLLLRQCYFTIGILHAFLENHQEAVNYYRKSRQIDLEAKHYRHSAHSARQIGLAYWYLNQPDSAWYYHKLSLEEDPDQRLTSGYWILSGIYESSRAPQLARGYFLKGIQIERKEKDSRLFCLSAHNLADFYVKQGQLDSAIAIAREGYLAGNKINFLRGVAYNCDVLAKAFTRQNTIDSAFKYQSIMLAARDSLFGQNKLNKIQTTLINEQQRIQKLEEEKKDFENRVRLSFSLGIALVLLLFSIFFYSNQRKTRAANFLLTSQNEKISHQRRLLEESLTDLQSTQSQLIQKEKLASLGELTAGIAHEIQNPLNFVNNYSEVNMELIEELQEEAEKGDTEEIRALLTDLSDNERKIHHHGRRADAIVRGMLEHARATPGEKVPTDLNALADEYLRLAYHGLRAKDPEFQCELITDFDPNLGKVLVAPSELGRVLLNLFNNAFYALQQRAMLVADQAYTPTVWVSTHRLNDKVEIKIRDNGTGMPPEVQEKIFQPFFTTKPTGEGTGLGLSLSYDIVTKGHGGALRLESKVGEGTEFVVELPFG